MSLTLCPRVEDGWVHDYVEDLTLTPTPREEVDWSLIPDEVINLILLFVDLANIHYWSDITAQKSYDCMALCRPKDVPIVELHMNKRLLINDIKKFQYHWQGKDFAGVGTADAKGGWLFEEGESTQYDEPQIFEHRRLDGKIVHTEYKGPNPQTNYKYLFMGMNNAPKNLLWSRLKRQKSYKVKVVKKNNKKGQSKSRCSLCGKVGHNKNNRKFH